MGRRYWHLPTHPQPDRAPTRPKEARRGSEVLPRTETLARTRFVYYRAGGVDESLEPLDWRLETREEPWMYDARLRWERYRAPTPDWDHDHCALCWAKFSDADNIEALREGYVARADATPAVVLSEEERTTYVDGHRIVASPNADEWICPTCFEDFRGRFGWKVDGSGP